MKTSIRTENGQDWLFGIGTLQLFIVFTYAFFCQHQGGKVQSKLQQKDTFQLEYSFILGHMERDVAQIFCHSAATACLPALTAFPTN